MPLNDLQLPAASLPNLSDAGAIPDSAPKVPKELPPQVVQTPAPGPKTPIDVSKILAAQGIDVAGAGDTPGTLRVLAPMGGVQASLNSPAPQDGSWSSTLNNAAQSVVADQHQGDGRKEITINVNDMLKGLGVADTSKYNLLMNTPAAPVPDSPLGFVDRFKYEAAQTIPDQAKFLADRYGAQNVKYDKAKGLLVNDRGVWHQASATGFAGAVGANGDVIAGAALGAEIGTALFPGVGTIAGIAIGGIGAGLGAMVMRLGSYEAAKAAGLRTEQDAEQTQNELAKEGILALAGHVLTTTAVKSTIGAIELVGNAMSTIGNKAGSDDAKNKVAQLLTTMTGSKPGDIDNMRMWIEDPNAVKVFQKEAVAHENLSPEKRPAQNPVKADMAENVQNATLQAKKTMNADYAHAAAELEPITKDIQVPLGSTLQGIQSELQREGLMTPSGKFDPEKSEALTQATNDPTTVSKIEQAWRIIRRAVGDTSSIGEVARGGVGGLGAPDAEVTPEFDQGAARILKPSAPPAEFDHLGFSNSTDTVKNPVDGKGGTLPDMRYDNNLQRLVPVRNTTLSFDDAHTLVRNMDEILEAAGMYGKAAASMTSSGHATIMKYRSDINDQIIAALRAKNPEAAAARELMNQKYSGTRSVLDDFAEKTSDQKVDTMINTMLGGDNGARNRMAMTKLLQDAKIDVEPFMRRLYQQKAGLATTRLFTSDAGVRGALTMKEKSVPMLANAYAKLQNTAHLGQQLQLMAPALKNSILTNPAALGAVGDAYMQSNAIADHLPGAILQHVGVGQPQQQQGQ